MGSNQTHPFEAVSSILRSAVSVVHVVWVGEEIFHMHPGMKVQKLSARGKMAIRLYVTGACKTLKEASEAAGLHPMYLQYLIKSPAGQEYAIEHDTKIDNASVNLSTLIASLGQEAVATITTVMRHAEKPEVRLKAATDLLDRNPVTSKIQKHQVEQFTLNGRDAKALADALVESARVVDMFPEAATGDFVKIQQKELPSGPPQTPES